MAADVILHFIGEIGFDGATYRAMQFDGPGATHLSMDDRMTIANMAIEAGGKNSIFEFDAQTQAYVDYRCKQTEEHTSELQSRLHLVCRLLLEKKKKHIILTTDSSCAAPKRPS